MIFEATVLSVFSLRKGDVKMPTKMLTKATLLVVTLALAFSGLQYVLARPLCEINCSAYLSTPWTQVGRESLAAAVAATAAWESIVYAAALAASAYATARGELQLFLAGMLAYVGIRLLDVILYVAAMYLTTNFFVEHYNLLTMLYDSGTLMAIVVGFVVTLGSLSTAIKVLLAAAAARLILDPIPPLIYDCKCMSRTVVAIRLGSLLGSAAYIIVAYFAAQRWGRQRSRQRKWIWTGWWQRV